MKIKEDGLYSALSLWVDDIDNKSKGGVGASLLGDNPSLTPSAVKHIRHLLEVFRGDREDAFGLKHGNIHEVKDETCYVKPPLYMPKPYIRKMIIDMMQHSDEKPDNIFLDDYLDELVYIVREHINMLLQHKYTDKTHYCPDWDYQLISDKSPEFSSCLCFKRGV